MLLVQLMTEPLRHGILIKVTVLTQPFSQVTVTHFHSAQMDRLSVQVMLMGIYGYGYTDGKLLSEVVAHSLFVTSISLSRNGNTILTSGRDNLHNLFDTRTLEVWGTLRASGNRVASNWSRSCISADDSYVAAGSVDGSVHVWSISNGNIVSNLMECTGSVLCCSWSGLGKPLATSDKNGIICMWT